MQQSPLNVVSVLAAGSLTRRRLIESSAAFFLHTAIAPIAPANVTLSQAAAKTAPAETPYDPNVLPVGIRSRFVDNINGIRMHVLEAGFDVKYRPAVVLLHGFPELAYSWRKLMVPIADAGFHVIAPDRRGYGRTSGWNVRYDHDLAPFTTLNQARDVLALASAFGLRSVICVIGHDFGSPLAAYCSLIRPDVFRSVVMMSAPFPGPPALPFNTVDATEVAGSPAADTIYEDLAKLNPPRKHYQKYFATREANENMWHAAQGVHDFLRAYYHMKSADWKENTPFPLKARTATEWAKLPRYYIMDLNKGMAETVAAAMPSKLEIAICKWLPENELTVYSNEYQRTGFQGGLNEYRVRWVENYRAELRLYSGRTIDVPSLFIAGNNDWGAYQNPGDLEKMQTVACTRMKGAHLVNGAGHWVQQEQPEDVSRLLLEFLREL